MTEFRECPSYPTYFASQCGLIVRRRTLKTSGKLKETALKPFGSNSTRFISIGKGWVNVEVLIADAWNEGAGAFDYSGRSRPLSSYPDGRVMTVGEWIEEKKLSSAKAV